MNMFEWATIATPSDWGTVGVIAALFAMWTALLLRLARA